MYRHRHKQSAKLTAARASRERKRLDGPAPDYCDFVPPDLRRIITVTDYDFGEVTHTIKLYATNRIDTYRAEADGQPWRDRLGWSGVLQTLRKTFTRVQSL